MHILRQEALLNKKDTERIKEYKEERSKSKRQGRKRQERKKEEKRKRNV